jgi:hypothetical protein
MSNEDAVKIDYRSEYGISVLFPMRFAKFEIPEHKELTWAQKKQSELIWKLKKNIAKKNRIKRVVFKVLSTILILALTLVVLFFAAIHHAPIGIPLGLITGISLLVTHLKIDSQFETDTCFIYPQRKNKTYY